MSEVPNLTPQRQQFVIAYVSLGFTKPSEAYKQAYNCENMSPDSIAVEAQKLLNDPKITLCLEFARKNVKEVFEEEIKYSAKDCFDELDEVRERAKKDKGNYSQELKAIELKGKLAGRFVDKHQVTGGGLADVLDQLK